MSRFGRTISGKIAKHLFYPDRVMVWVEGGHDEPFYNWLTGKIKVKISGAGGKPECRLIAERILSDDLAYVVVMDGDYDILERSRSPHRRIVILSRYSIENYLLDEPSLLTVINSCAGDPDGGAEVRISKMISHAEEVLGEAIRLDATCVRYSLDGSPLPSRIDVLLANDRSFAIDEDKVNDCCVDFKSKVSRDELKRTNSLIDDWCLTRRLVWLLRGGLALGIIRRIILQELVVYRKLKWNADNRTLRALLASHVWQGTLSPDHRNLRRRFREAVRDAAASHLKPS